MNGLDLFSGIGGIALAMRSLDGRSKALLSPRFVEWMMGFPIGWTDCDPSVTVSFRSQHE